MDTRSELHIADPEARLLKELKSLLEKQISLAHRGDISGTEALSKQADSLVGKIAQAGILQRPDLSHHREKLERLYHTLCLAITAKRAETSERLSGVRKYKKTIQAYRRNI